MKFSRAQLFAIMMLALTGITVLGCMLSSAGDPGRPSENDGTRASAATPMPPRSSIPSAPGSDGSDPLSGATIRPGGAVGPWVPGDGDDYDGLPGTNETNRTPGSPTPTPIVSGEAADWGTDKNTYARGDTATGWVYVTNTGNVPIAQIDFTLVIKRTIFFVPVEKRGDYSQTGLNIMPGETRRVEFSQPIPAEYSGMSTAGDYQFTVTAYLAGNSIGSYSKSIRVT